jgi:hypothetical protein
LNHARKRLKKSELCKVDPTMVKELKERANGFVSSNCRGKWVILASSLTTGMFMVVLSTNGITSLV